MGMIQEIQNTAKMNSKGKSEAEEVSHEEAILKFWAKKLPQKQVHWVLSNSNESYPETRTCQETYFKIDWEKKIL